MNANGQQGTFVSGGFMSSDGGEDDVMFEELSDEFDDNDGDNSGGACVSEETLYPEFD